MLTPEQKLIYRIIKTRWEPATHIYQQNGDGQYWRLIKQITDYTSSKRGVDHALNYARRYSTPMEHYTVHVAVAVMPVFRDYRGI